MQQDTISKAVVLVLALGISALFMTMIAPFLMALFLAGLASALAQPLFLRLTDLFGGRRALASLASLSLMTLVVLIPLVLLAGVLVSQALDVSQLAGVWVGETLTQPEAFAGLLRRLPFYEQLAPHWGKIAQQAGDAAGALSKIAVEGLSSLTLGTVNFIFMLFVFLYSLYFLLMDGDQLVDKLLYYLPLKTTDERMMLAKFTSVTRATLRGSLLIGLLQGTLAGIAFAVAGIPNAIFWGSAMAIFSMIPNVGSALIWVPAVVLLIVQGQVLTGVLLAAFCGLLVGSLDNVLRPILVGKDTKMHELMIFFSTLGGLFMFGFPGIFIGPVIGSLLVSIWEIYGVEFADSLPEVEGSMGSQGETGFIPGETPASPADQGEAP
ncbi:AI-2E family transporter [Candidatus Thiodictyon syntrophicum]|jgi:predicted PurR-regulated permease PerM|uniref:AI-2E family transporter n=1 Tax=Candidatus Thiodictyon syntrophicum TaxID=1166950 RepID=A0A2K8UC17_9GAMM|nr:AI-2E family transporter [Candidatus Thiodictyon syntrophicum]AUB82979.1 AI-2E family transporter [Candidatus Thiodictyon syntrophicum]